MINVGVIGYGYWGPNLVRNFASSDKTQVVAVSDLNTERLALMKKNYPYVRATSDYHDILSATDIDAVAIPTPVNTHYEIALAALKAGKHVLVEKPMATTAVQCRHLIEEAAKRNLTLMVDHTFVYTGAVRKIKEIIDSGELGDIYYYDSTRINLGLFQQDIDVIWDLGVHDLSIMDFWLNDTPSVVSATGSGHVPGQPENLAYLSLFFENSLIAHVNVNWLAPVKLRRTLLGGSQKMIVFDDLEPSEKVKIYDKGISVSNSQEDIYKLLVSYRSGDMCAPRLDRTEALALEVNHFAECIDKGLPPLTNGEVGLRVVKILEAASSSMKQQGSPVKIEQE